MTQMTPWGAWNRIMEVANADLRHEIWCSVIREIARNTLARHGKLPVDSDDAEDEIEGVIGEWMRNALPCSTLLDIIGESDYFQDISLTWDEQFSFENEPSVSVLDVMYDLKSRYEHQEEFITEEVIASFFRVWQTCFLHRVCKEVQQLANPAQD